VTVEVSLLRSINFIDMGCASMQNCICSHRGSGCVLVTLGESRVVQNLKPTQRRFILTDGHAHCTPRTRNKCSISDINFAEVSTECFSHFQGLSWYQRTCFSGICS